jgi:glycosyltransferase involved in cell wall biosynthesis
MAVKKVLFITDRVMHYQRSTFQELERRLGQEGFELWLLSGEDNMRTTGRVGLATTIVKNEVKFQFVENFFFTYKVAWYKEIRKKIAVIRPSIVVNAAHSGNLSHWQISALKNEFGFRLISWLCGYEFHPGWLKRTLLNILIPRYDYHLAYHTNAMTYAYSHGAPQGRVTVIHNTIDERAITPGDKEAARKTLTTLRPQLAGKKIVLYVGAILAEKRLEVLVDAFDRMNRDEAVLLIVGDGEYMGRIAELVKGRRDVVLAGRIVDGVGSYFDAADMYVLPGTGGLGINEAMAHRLPVLSSYADGSADDLVVDGETGFRLRGGAEATDWADKIGFLLDHPEQARAMGLAGEQRIRGELSFERFVERVVSGVKTATAI